MAETCPYCRETIHDDDTIRCPSCSTPHHRECFAENAGCTVFGCESAPPDAPKISLTEADNHSAALPPPLPLDPDSAAITYFIHREGQQYGPYSLRELQRYVGERRIDVTDFAWTEGMGQWTFVSDVVGMVPNTTPHVTESRTAEVPRRWVTTDDSIDPFPSRMKFGRGLFFLALIGLVFVRAAFAGSKDGEGAGTFIGIVGWCVIAVLRLRDIGMNGWMVLLSVVPIANLFLYFRLLCAPRGYELTRKPDRAMKAIGWAIALLAVVSVLSLILISANR